MEQGKLHWDLRKMHIFSSLTGEFWASQKKSTLLRGNALIDGEMCYTFHTYLSERGVYVPIYKFKSE